MLFSNQTRATIESLLFISNEPLTVRKIADIIDVNEKDVLSLILEIQKSYEKEQHGFAIIEIAEGYIFATKPQYMCYVEKLYKPQLASISSAAIETLAIVAYKQPITRGEIEVLRGVKAEKIIHTLIEKGLIEELGRKDSPGRPILYGTTKQFLQYFGLKSLSELPDSKELEELVQLEDIEKELFSTQDINSK